MTDYEAIVIAADQLSLADKARLLEHLSTELRHDLELKAFRRMSGRNLCPKPQGF